MLIKFVLTLNLFLVIVFAGGFDFGKDLCLEKIEKQFQFGQPFNENFRNLIRIYATDKNGYCDEFIDYLKTKLQDNMIVWGELSEEQRRQAFSHLLPLLNYQESNQSNPFGVLLRSSVLNKDIFSTSNESCAQDFCQKFQLNVSSLSLNGSRYLDGLDRSQCNRLLTMVEKSIRNLLEAERIHSTKEHWTDLSNSSREWLVQSMFNQYYLKVNYETSNKTMETIVREVKYLRIFTGEYDPKWLSKEDQRANLARNYFIFMFVLLGLIAVFILLRFLDLLPI